MRLSTVLLSTLALPAAMSDHWTIVTQDSGNRQNGLWHTNTGVYSFDSSDGCHYPSGIPYVYDVCLDWNNRRGHFFAVNQPKRCLRETHNLDIGVCAAGHSYCRAHRWTEVPC